MRGCLLCLVPLLGAPSLAYAQVIEIDSAGQAQTYDRPTLFIGADPVPIFPAAPARPAPLFAARSAIADVGRAHGLAPGLLEAVAWQESRGRMGVVSPKGAIGVMQLMPATAAALGVNPRDLADNLRGGALYLRRQIDRFGSVPLALAAYNAGPGAVSRFGGIPPFRETRGYVSAIMGRWRAMIHDRPAESPQMPAFPLQTEVPSL